MTAHDTIPAPPPTEPQSEPPPPAQRVPSLVEWPEERTTLPGCPHPQHGPAPAHITETTAATAAESKEP